MRRSDKEIQSVGEISEVIRKCQVCRIALSKENKPYIVPVSFGYDEKAIYFHTVISKGLKLDYIAANNQVCFEFEHNVDVVADDEKPCGWSFTYQSVIGFGQVDELLGEEEKIEGLQYIMKQYSEKTWDFAGIPLHGVSVCKITIESMTGKQSSNFT
ncbi:MAG: nitroimidazol reductase NimA-like FMN-containing flavoprotein [Desulforhopalus sp.]|jgi:nitroimidazol reductase NimA-like FMN-containing flavoprotein (pyridoxamine 5'-phosphate oxidase superfamily)